MKKIRSMRYYSGLLMATFLICSHVNAVHRDEIYISHAELDEMLVNSNRKYIYLGKEWSNIHETVSRISALDDNKHSIIHELQQHIAKGFSVGLYDFVVEALSYAEAVLQKNVSKIHYKEAQDIAYSLYTLSRQVANESLTITAQKMNAFSISPIQDIPQDIQEPVIADDNFDVVDIIAKEQDNVVDMFNAVVEAINAVQENSPVNNSQPQAIAPVNAVNVSDQPVEFPNMPWIGCEPIIINRDVIFKANVWFKDKVKFLGKVKFDNKVKFEEDVTMEETLTVDRLKVRKCIEHLCVENLTVTDIIFTSCLDNLCVQNLTVTDLVVLSCIENLCVDNLTVTDLTVLSCIENLCVDNLTVTDITVLSCIESLCVDNLSVVNETVSGTLTVTDLVVLSCMESLCVQDLTVTDLVVLSCVDTLCVTNLSVGNEVIGCDLTVGCNISMNDSISAAIGNIIKGGNSFMTNFGVDNTFLGILAGNFTMTGAENVGIGRQALFSNTTGFENVAVGAFALPDNTTGENNIAIGAFALVTNTTGNENTALGGFALSSNITGMGNTAVGFDAGFSLTAGDDNTLLGSSAAALATTGSSNVIIGHNSGISLVTGSNNIYVANPGNTSESGIIRIGTPATHTSAFVQGIFGSPVSLTGLEVFVDSFGQLGTVVSSSRFKHNIQDMDQEDSGNIYNLHPVTFVYNNDETDTRQYGLIAEEVAQVFPSLVIHDEDGVPYTVRYHILPMLLLNEVQKLHGIVQDQAVAISELSLDNKKFGEAIEKVIEKINALNLQ